ncbi:MAG: hypothetical protein K6F52_05430 [Clostridia bacterium]|nr:hypothetical protein [Clostridia bacterium]
MSYVWAVLAGIIYGGGVGFLKYLLLWRRVFHPKEGTTVTSKAVVSRMIISFIVNAATLVAVYLVRNIIPFDFVAFAIATAIALSLAGKAFSIHKVYQLDHVEK